MKYAISMVFNVNDVSSSENGVVMLIVHDAVALLKVFPHMYTFGDDILSIPTLHHSMV